MDIGPGDRVICIKGAEADHGQGARIYTGRIYTVRYVADFIDARGIVRPGAFLADAEASIPPPGGRDYGWGIERFRKLPDISEWLETSTSYEEPRRVPATPETVTA